MVLAYPGIEVREINLAQQVQGPAGIAAAVAGASARGRIGERILCTTVGDFIDKFGIPVPAIGYMHYAAIQFLKQGNQLFAARANATGAAYGGVVFCAQASATNSLILTGPVTDLSAFSFTGYTGGLIGIFADNQGDWGNTVAVSVTNVDETELTFDINVYSIVNNVQVLQETWTVSRQHKLDGFGRQLYLEDKINNESNWIRVKDNTGVANTVLPAHAVVSENIGTGSVVTTPIVGEAIGVTDGSGDFSGPLVNTPVEPLSVTISDGTNTFVDNGAGVLTGAPSGTGTINYSTGAITIVGGALTQPLVGSYTYVSAPGPTQFSATLTESPVIPGSVSITDGVETFTDNLNGGLIGSAGGTGTIEYSTGSVAVDFNAAPGDGIAVLANYFFGVNAVFSLGANGAASTDGQLISAWDLFTSTEDVDVRILMDPGHTSVAVKNRLIDLAETRLDCVALLSVPTDDQEASEAVVWRRNTLNANTTYAAAYTADVLDFDQYNNVQLYVPPIGYIAGQWVVNYRNNTPGTPPAGTDMILNVLDLNEVYDTGEQGLLYSNQINYIRNKPGTGFLVWGNETLTPQKSPLNRINIRMLLIFIRLGLLNSLDDVVFKLNNEFTRLRVTQRISAFLQQFADNGDLDTSTDEGFFVQCDEQNNPPPIRQNNQLIVDVYIKPSSAAEFITINLLITDQGTDFNELIASRVA